MSSNIADAALVSPVPARPSPLFAVLLTAYLAVLGAAWISGNGWLQGLAAFALVTLLLSPALRCGSIAGWSVWTGGAIALGLLVAHGDGRAALDMLPVLVNGALCVLFARTLLPGRTALISQIIVIMEGAERLSLPRVAAYARHLTFAWAILFGVQAFVIFFVLSTIAPDGMLAMLGIRSPVALDPAWRWYVHAGSYATAALFMLGEYAFRCWHLRAIPHAPLAVFIQRLARRWPALVRELVDPPIRGRA